MLSHLFKHLKIQTCFYFSAARKLFTSAYGSEECVHVNILGDSERGYNFSTGYCEIQIAASVYRVEFMRQFSNYVGLDILEKSLHLCDTIAYKKEEGNNHIQVNEPNLKLGASFLEHRILRLCKWSTISCTRVWFY